MSESAGFLEPHVRALAPWLYTDSAWWTVFGILGNVFITLSGVTPASSVFIIVPVALVAVGSGSFLSFVFAAIVGVFMAFCWAELSAAYPIAAGDYALVWHSFKGRTSWLAGPVSFVTFALYVDFIAFIPAVIALGTGTYLAVIVNVNLKVIGAVVMLLAAAIAILNIRLNAVITGIFLAVARIAGETAPLLLTAGFNNFWPDSLGDFTPTLPPYIFKYATSPYESQQRLAWAAAFVLMVVVLLLTFGIRFVTGKRVVLASRAE